jgi:hypothetical protein
MSSWLTSVLRTGAQALVGYLVTWLASHGVNVPVEQQDWLVQVLLVGGAITLYTAAVRWLETRKGDSAPAKLARLVAKLLMLGLSGKQPVYVDPAATVRVNGVLAQGQPLRESQSIRETPPL